MGPAPTERFPIKLGLTQLVGGWGYLGGLRPPKYPQFSPELRNSYKYLRQLLN